MVSLKLVCTFVLLFAVGLYGLEEESRCRWYRIRNRYIAGNNNLVRRGTVSSCARICTSRGLRLCKSFDYNRVTRLCFFQAVTQRSRRLSRSGIVDYYERRCRKYLCGWRIYRNRYVRDRNILKLTRSSLWRCKVACRRRRACRSFEYYRGTCYLNRYSRYLKYARGWNLYAKTCRRAEEENEGEEEPETQEEEGSEQEGEEADISEREQESEQAENNPEGEEEPENGREGDEEAENGPEGDEEPEDDEDVQEDNN